MIREARRECTVTALELQSICISRGPLPSYSLAPLTICFANGLSMDGECTLSVRSCFKRFETSSPFSNFSSHHGANNTEANSFRSSRRFARFDSSVICNSMLLPIILLKDHLAWHLSSICLSSDRFNPSSRYLLLARILCLSLSWRSGTTINNQHPREQRAVASREREWERGWEGERERGRKG